MSSKIVLVTGAFGQVGKRCTEILLNRGRTVVAMDVRSDRSAAAAADLAATSHAGKLIPKYTDLTDAQAVAAVVEHHRPDAIVHLAAIVSPPSYRNPRLARRVNVDGTRHLAEAARALSDPPLFVFASSAAVYGSRNPYRQPERITGDTPVNPIDQYGEDKVMAEAVITKSNLPHAILRLGGVLSPDASANVDGDYLLLVRATPADALVSVAVFSQSVANRRRDAFGPVVQRGRQAHHVEGPERAVAQREDLTRQRPAGDHQRAPESPAAVPPAPRGYRSRVSAGSPHTPESRKSPPRPSAGRAR